MKGLVLWNRFNPENKFIRFWPEIMTEKVVKVSDLHLLMLFFEQTHLVYYFVAQVIAFLR
jgi:hypothetical protein